RSEGKLIGRLQPAWMRAAVPRAPVQGRGAHELDYACMSSCHTGPLLTSRVHEILREAVRNGSGRAHCSLDLQRSLTQVDVLTDHWLWNGERYPFLATCKERTIYYWAGESFEAAARYTRSLVKLVPTEWGAPTFEIDG